MDRWTNEWTDEWTDGPIERTTLIRGEIPGEAKRAATDADVSDAVAD